MKNEEKKIEDQALDKVAGGFIENRGYAKGEDIYCPFCGAYKKRDFYLEKMPWMETNKYECYSCGEIFYVDIDGDWYEG